MFSFFTNRKKASDDIRDFGKWGEKLAVRYLKGKDYKVLALNYNCNSGEIDIIAFSPKAAIVFVEVKTRRNEDFARAVDAVNKKKQIRIARAARHFIKSKKIRGRPIRFDVITIVGTDKKTADITHYENAFQPAGL